MERTIEIQYPNPLAAARAWQIKLPLPDHLLSSIHPTTVAYAILQHQTKMISFQNAHPKIVRQTFQFNQVKAIKACQDVSVVFSFQKVVSKQDTLEIQLQALVSAISTICEIVGFATQLLDIRKLMN